MIYVKKLLYIDLSLFEDVPNVRFYEQLVDILMQIMDTLTLVGTRKEKIHLRSGFNLMMVMPLMIF